jgi:hypothetical protein
LDASSNRKKKIIVGNNKTQKYQLRQYCKLARLRKYPENPLRMYNSDREEEDCLLKFSETTHY